MNKREWMLQAALAVLRSGEPYTVDEMSANYDAIIAAATQEGAWVEYDGDVSKAPPEDRMVHWESEEAKGTDLAKDLLWDHVGDEFDILRWRYA